MTKITKKELHPSLIKYISDLAGSNSGSGSGGGTLVQKKNTVIINTQTTEVNIGIPEYDKDTDVLMVFKNSTYLEENEDYTISEDSTKINSINETWNTSNIEMTFNFIVFKNVPELTRLDGSLILDGSIPLSKLSNDIINLIQTSSSISSRIVEIGSTSWTYSEVEGLYYTEISYDLLNEDIFNVSMYNNDNDSLLSIVKFVNNDKIRIYNDESINAKVYILSSNKSNSRKIDNTILSLINDMKNEISELKSRIKELEK